MAAYPLCDEGTNSYVGGWLTDQITSNGVTLVLLILLLIHGVYKTSTTEPMTYRLSIAYLLLIVIGLCWMLSDLFRVVIDPFTHILQDNAACDLVAYMPKVAYVLFYAAYLAQIMMRLHQSFKESYLAVSKRLSILLQGLLAVTFSSALYSVFFVDYPQSTCIASWKVNDVDRVLFYCDYQMTPARTLWVWGCLVAFNLFNIVLCVLFAVKLRRLLAANEDNDHLNLPLKTLIFKNSILTLTGSVSTIAAYAVWIYFPVSATPLYIDLVVNCLVIGLMLKSNEAHYLCLCRPCILVCMSNEGIMHVCELSTDSSYVPPNVQLSTSSHLKYGARERFAE